MRILIVEDEHLIADSLKKGLILEKMIVDVAYDGVEGYDLAASEPYDVILLDVMLPGMDGMTFCKELRLHGIMTPVLMLTAQDQIEKKVQGLEYGADDYLTKPFAFEELLARIRALARRPQQTVAELLKVGDLIVDTGTYRAVRGGDTIVLSKKEYAVLIYLMRNSGKTVTKDELISHCWEFDTDVLHNTVEVYIKNLRSKIDVPYPKKKPLLQTVRGFGYTITD